MYISMNYLQKWFGMYISMNYLQKWFGYVYLHELFTKNGLDMDCHSIYFDSYKWFPSKCG